MIVSITDWLFCIGQDDLNPESNAIWHFNTAVRALDRGWTEHCGPKIISLALEGCLQSLADQKMFSSLTSNLNILKNNLIISFFLLEDMF